MMNNEVVRGDTNHRESDPTNITIPEALGLDVTKDEEIFFTD